MLNIEAVVLNAIEESSSFYLGKVKEYRPDIYEEVRTSLLQHNGIPHHSATEGVPERYAGRLSGQCLLATSAGFAQDEVFEAIARGAGTKVAN
jgi:hypothetical protein